jgi:predicted amidohydrolase
MCTSMIGSRCCAVRGITRVTDAATTASALIAAQYTPQGPRRCQSPKPSSDLVLAARACDVALATANRCWVVRADVAGIVGGLRSEGSSAVISPAGTTVSSARALSDDLPVTEIDLAAV